MEKQQLSQGEWQIMQLLWVKPYTLMELVAELGTTIGWSKSTVATMVRRMEGKGLIGYETEDRTKRFHPLLQQEEAAIRETHSLLSRAYRGSIGLLVSSLAHAGELTKDDIDELYAILKEAEDDVT